MNAIKFHTDGTVENVELPEQADTTAILDALQHHIAGPDEVSPMIERVTIAWMHSAAGEPEELRIEPRDLIVNESGMILGLPVNPIATALYCLNGHLHGMRFSSSIHGPALLLSERLA